MTKAAANSVALTARASSLGSDSMNSCTRLLAMVVGQGGPGGESGDGAGGGRRSVVDEDDAATTGDDNKDSLPAWPPVIVGRDPGAGGNLSANFQN